MSETLSMTNKPLLHDDPEDPDNLVTTRASI
jgi:hypothetical protein